MKSLFMRCGIIGFLLNDILWRWKVIIRTEKDGETVIAVGDNCHDLARILGITPQAVSHGIHRGSVLYHVVEDYDETNRCSYYNRL